MKKSMILITMLFSIINAKEASLLENYGEASIRLFSHKTKTYESWKNGNVINQSKKLINDINTRNTPIENDVSRSGSWEEIRRNYINSIEDVWDSGVREYSIFFRFTPYEVLNYSTNSASIYADLSEYSGTFSGLASSDESCFDNAGCRYIYSESIGSHIVLKSINKFNIGKPNEDRMKVKLIFPLRNDTWEWYRIRLQNKHNTPITPMSVYDINTNSVHRGLPINTPDISNSDYLSTCSTLVSRGLNQVKSNYPNITVSDVSFVLSPVGNESSLDVETKTTNPSVRFVKKDTLNTRGKTKIYAKPDRRSRILTKLDRYKKLTRLPYTDSKYQKDGWFRVIFNDSGDTGFVQSKKVTDPYVVPYNPKSSFFITPGSRPHKFTKFKEFVNLFFKRQESLRKLYKTVGDAVKGVDSSIKVGTYNQQWLLDGIQGGGFDYHALLNNTNVDLIQHTTNPVTTSNFDYLEWSLMYDASVSRNMSIEFDTELTWSWYHFGDKDIVSYNSDRLYPESTQGDNSTIPDSFHYQVSRAMKHGAEGFTYGNWSPKEFKKFPNYGQGYNDWEVSDVDYYVNLAEDTINSNKKIGIYIPSVGLMYCNLANHYSEGNRLAQKNIVAADHGCDASEMAEMIYGKDSWFEKSGKGKGFSFQILSDHDFIKGLKQFSGFKRIIIPQVFAKYIDQYMVEVIKNHSSSVMDKIKIQKKKDVFAPFSKEHNYRFSWWKTSNRVTKIWITRP
jgi:hypothetical protein